MDTYADDLAAVIEALDLREITLVGHSTVAARDPLRRPPRHRARRAGPPARRDPAADAEDGCEPGGASDRGLRPDPRRRRADRSQFYKDLSAPFYGANREGSKVSQGVREQFWRLSMQVGMKGAYDLRQGLLGDRPDRGPEEDRRPDPDRHGDDDQIVPIDDSARKSVEFGAKRDAQGLPGAPHGISTTHKDEFNADLLDFMQA